MENEKINTYKDYKNLKQLGFVNFSRRVSLPNYLNDSIKTNYKDLGQSLSKVIEKNEKFKKILKNFEKNEDEIDKLTIKKRTTLNKVKDLQTLIGKKQEKVNLLKSKAKNLDITSNQAIKEILRIKDNPNYLYNCNINGKIYGKLINLIKVKDGYLSAIKVSAGEKLNHILVDNQKTANQCINYLKRFKIGRACFIPLENVRTYPFNFNFKKSNRVIGRAIDLIQFNPEFKRAFEFVFGRIIIVTDLNTAIHFEVNATRVTLDGDICEPSNLISGGYKKSFDEYENKYSELLQIQALEEEIIDIKKDQISLVKELNQLYNLEKARFLSI